MRRIPISAFLVIGLSLGLTACSAPSPSTSGQNSQPIHKMPLLSWVNQVTLATVSTAAPKGFGIQSAAKASCSLPGKWYLDAKFSCDIEDKTGVKIGDSTGVVSKNTSGNQPEFTVFWSPVQTPTTSTLPTTTTPPPSPLSYTYKDGSFAFKISSITCGDSAFSVLSNDGLNGDVPSGAQECLIYMSVTNDKGSMQTYFASNQYAYEHNGRKFSSDSNVATFLTGANSYLDVNPGITIQVIVPFQIPANVSLFYLTLHDSAFSKGVTVPLT